MVRILNILSARGDATPEESRTRFIAITFGLEAARCQLCFTAAKLAYLSRPACITSNRDFLSLRCRKFHACLWDTWKCALQSKDEETSRMLRTNRKRLKGTVHNTFGVEKPRRIQHRDPIPTYQSQRMEGLKYVHNPFLPLAHRGLAMVELKDSAVELQLPSSVNRSCNPGLRKIGIYRIECFFCKFYPL
jgi:hypothetical protein